jgi:ATP-binding cassette subfamily B protein
VWEALADAGLADEVAAMAEGLSTPLGAHGVRLSGGQAQRLATARAVVPRPELLVLDDLSSALDVATEQALWARLLAEPRPTVLAVSHRPAVLDRADAVVVLEDGHVAAGVG